MVTFAAVAEIIMRDGTRLNSQIASSLNRTATNTRKESIPFITNKVKLSSKYVGDRISVTKRASPQSLEAVITGKDKETLVSRFSYRKLAGGGVNVSINKTGAGNDLRAAFIIGKLRNSRIPGVAMRNKAALEYMKQTSGGNRSSKLAKLTRRAAENPRGIYVLKSRSIQQMYRDAEKSLSPSIIKFFNEDFRRRLK